MGISIYCGYHDRCTGYFHSYSTKLDRIKKVERKYGVETCDVTITIHSPLAHRFFLAAPHESVSQNSSKLRLKMVKISLKRLGVTPNRNGFAPRGLMEVCARATVSDSDN